MSQISVLFITIGVFFSNQTVSQADTASFSSVILEYKKENLEMGQRTNTYSVKLAIQSNGNVILELPNENRTVLSLSQVQLKNINSLIDQIPTKALVEEKAICLAVLPSSRVSFIVRNSAGSEKEIFWQDTCRDNYLSDDYGKEERIVLKLRQILIGFLTLEGIDYHHK